MSGTFYYLFISIYDKYMFIDQKYTIYGNIPYKYIKINFVCLTAFLSFLLFLSPIKYFICIFHPQNKKNYYNTHDIKFFF